MGSTFQYNIFGLTIESALPLPELVASSAPARRDVAITFGPIEASPDAPHGYSGANPTLLNAPPAGRYLISGGSKIVIDPAPGASERHIRLFLLGSAFGALLHQRGLVPLHANSIQVDGHSVAFSGRSGAGKSTLAAWFHDRGYGVLADDVCVIGNDERGPPLAFPGIPRLRLWREALQAVGRNALDYGRSFDDMDKYDVPTRTGLKLSPIPLSRIYMLAKVETVGEAPSVRRVVGADAVSAIVSNTYRGDYVKTIGRTGDHLMQCIRIARGVEVYQARLAWGFDKFDEQARMLEQHARSN